MKLYDDASAFIEALRPMWEAREAELNLLLGLACMIRDGWKPERGLSMATLEREGRPRAAVLRTPPHGFVMAADAPASAAELARALVERRLGLDAPTLVATPAVAAEFAAVWSGATHQRTELAVAQRIYQTSEVCAPPPAAGSFRPANPGELSTLGAWIHAFMHEAGLPEAGTPDAGLEMARVRIERGRLYVWEIPASSGEPGGVVSMAALARPTPSGITVNSVYTPPALRGRGYASQCVAALTRHALDGGKGFVCLYTDAANPTANALYERIGYRFVCESALWRLR